MPDCQKKKFLSREAAEIRAYQIEQANIKRGRCKDKHRQYAYLCRHANCGFWHLSRQKPRGGFNVCIKGKKISDHIRDHIMQRGTVKALMQSEWSPLFEHLMRNRLIVGALRYAPLAVKRKSPGVSAYHVQYIRDKLANYEQTGNMEMLVDIANLALIEFVTGDDKRRHFEAEDGKHEED